MTAAEWASCAEPNRMLRSVRGRMSDRQARLFLVACCRGIFQVIVDRRARSMVEVGERLADGLATPAEVAEVVRNFFAASGEHHAEVRVRGRCQARGPTKSRMGEGPHLALDEGGRAVAGCGRVPQCFSFPGQASNNRSSSTGLTAPRK